jgi:hypothetical protein
VVLRFFARCMASLVLTLAIVLTSRPDAVFAASQESPRQGAASSERAGSKSEAAEAWDAVKDTTDQALLEAFIARYGTTFFADIAKARLKELKAAAAKPPSAQQPPTLSSMPKDGVREQAALFEEDPADAKGRRFDGLVTWRIERVKVDGKPDELEARADAEIPARGLHMTMLLKRNLDPSLPASHVVELRLGFLADVDSRGIANVPGILMKSNLQARGTPLAGLSVKVANGSFLVGLSSASADPERNLKLLLDRAWVDIPIVYGNQRRAILAIDKGMSGQQVFKTVVTAWGQYPAPTRSEGNSDGPR